jgi:hypothetical protein
MVSMKKWMLAAALAVGTLGLGASQAQAARFHVGVYADAPVAYVPPCPGPGYAWVAGYYAQGAWVPGFWRAPRVEVVRGGGYWGHPVYGHPYYGRTFHATHFRR